MTGISPTVPMRVMSFHATKWRYSGSGADSIPLDLGRLTNIYKQFREQLPIPLTHLVLGADRFRLEAAIPEIEIVEVNAYLFALPSDQTVMTFIFDLAVPRDGLADTLGRFLDECTQSVDGRGLTA